jgi:hypothetical protein
MSRSVNKGPRRSCPRNPTRAPSATSESRSSLGRQHVRGRRDDTMPGVAYQEPTTRSSERCDLHPGSPSVATCDGCGRPLCLACAVPVRGSVLGAECLAEVLGPGLGPEPSPPPDRGRFLWAVIGIAFAISAVASLLPWTRFGEGSGLFGAWGRHAEWSLLAAVAATTGLAAWLVASRSASRARRLWVAVEAALGAAVFLGAALAAVHPPPFTRPWVGTWGACIGGAIALGAAIARLRLREPEASRV